MAGRDILVEPAGDIIRHDRSEAEVASNLSYQPYTLRWNTVSVDGHAGHQGKLKRDSASGLIPYNSRGDNMLTALKARGCKILFVVTMYDEGFQSLDDTMRGVCSNLQTFQKFNVSSDTIGVVIVMDGLKPFMNSLKKDDNELHFSDLFSSTLIKDHFDPEDGDILKCTVPDDESFAHVFMVQIKFGIENTIPVQLFFCVKHQNKGKLNSHLWFFGGFCGEIQPEYVFLLDVGTIPQRGSLYYLYDAMDRDPYIGGCCGEIQPIMDTCVNYVIPAQALEYKFSHIFDKALESIIGYITVLPGAFSAYRWEALQGTPLWTDYFKHELNPDVVTPFEANMYLAEDRILCLSLISKKNANYTLKYVNYSKAKTDVPPRFKKLIMQRRRWINGSWFALIHLLKSYKNVWNSKHTCFRKSVFSVLMFYFIINVVFSWFLVSSFFIFVIISFRTLEDYKGTNDITSVANWAMVIYMALLIVIVITALTVRPVKVSGIYRFISTVMGFLMLITLGVILYLLFDHDFQNDWAIYILIGSSGLFALNIVLNCEICNTIKWIFYFMFMTPSYVNILYIYAICNTNDISWGNRGSAMTEKDREKQDEFDMFRYRWLLIWIMTNLVFGYVVDTYDEENQDNNIVYVIALVGGLLLLLRTIFGIVYFFTQLCQWKAMKKESERRRNRACNATEGPSPSRNAPRQVRPDHSQDDGIRTPERPSANRQRIAEKDSMSEDNVLDATSLSPLRLAGENKKKTPPDISIEERKSPEAEEKLLKSRKDSELLPPKKRGAEAEPENEHLNPSHQIGNGIDRQSDEGNNADPDRSQNNIIVDTELDFLQ